MPADALAANLAGIEERIESACKRAGRQRSEITLVAVSKTFPSEAIEQVIGLGVHDIAENRVQELETKKPRVSSQARWHLVGHLQSNKARQAARLADVIQTVDSERIAQKLSTECASLGRTLDVLLQVNIGRELQKSGIDPDGVEPVLRAVVLLPHLRPVGLMAIPPAQGDPRPHFFALRMLRDALNDAFGNTILATMKPTMKPAMKPAMESAIGNTMKSAINGELRLPYFTELSMGMSEDFEVAIEEGATMIRLGRSVFGERS